MEAGRIHHLGKDSPPPDLTEVLSTARAALDQEFQISQFLDTKARGLVTVAAQWFGIAQAVAAVAYATKKPETWMLLSVAGVALAGAVALGVVCVYCWKAWKIRDEFAVSPMALLKMRDAISKDGSPAQLVDHYAARLKDRRSTNAQRADAVSGAEIAWFFAMAIPLVEIGLALATRLFV